MTKAFLFATDLLEGSHFLAQRAKKLADELGATLSMMHVVELPISVQYAHALGFAELLEPSTAEAQTVLATLAEEFNISEAHQFVTLGSAAQEVIDFAKHHHIDAIIIGSHAHTALPNFLGSTANAIVHKAPCDVITLRTPIKG